MEEQKITSDKTFLANSDSKLQNLSTRHIAVKLQKEVSASLKKYLDDPNDKDIITSVNDLLLKTLSILTNFDENLFRFEICKDDKAESLTVKPLNLISALWLRGMNVKIDDIINDHYEDNFACYFWEENKMVVSPKDRRDLFSYEF